ncbi:hypothetical protein GOBAR_AA24876 [Gossypium barbadense]|uniref:Uncharacterized protein n=1 Tax=Gossypium barbadense TaxID=3634 RepID=A0A2P5WXJ1_GOSBA|nr:hypothetical protein GOBAR_AA24876 [Gossypium barbadense]
MEYKNSYEIVENEDEESPDVSSITKVLEWNDAGEATVIEHIMHIHHLTLSDRVECKKRTCLRCIIALTPGAHTCVGHKHPVFLYTEYTGRCVACGLEFDGLLRFIQKAIFAIFVKNVKIQIFGFIIVQHVILLLMSIVSLMNNGSSNSGVSLKDVKTFMSTLSLLLRRFITIRIAVIVISPV